MADDLLQKVEEKVMALLTELEVSRKEIARLREENDNLKTDKNHRAQKLQELMSLLEVLDDKTKSVMVA